MELYPCVDTIVDFENVIFWTNLKTTLETKKLNSTYLTLTISAGFPTNAPTKPSKPRDAHKLNIH